MTLAAVGFLTLLLAAGADSLSAQQTSPIDTTKLLAEVGASYYHPDDLFSLDCAVAIDFTGFLKQLGQSPDGERMKAMNGMKVNVHAFRGQNAVVDIAWSQGALASKESMESGLKQMLNGFFQMYWPMFASSLAPGPHDSVRAEAKAAGGYILHSTADGAATTTEVNGEYLPTRLIVDSPVMKGAVEVQFAPSPNPTPGDLRRLTSAGITQQIGTNTIKVQIGTDYQDAEGFHIPRHVSFDMGGGLSIPLEFASCSATKAAAPPEPKSPR